MTNPTYLSIVIPCYNEARNLRLGALAQVAYFLEKKPYSWEVIVVDDGSTDESLKLLQEFIKNKLKFHVIQSQHSGKASSVIRGMIEARGEHVLFTDLDQATPITELDKVLPWFEKDYDVVIGSRNMKREGAPLLRSLMAVGFIFLRKFILGLKNVRDTQCGFKAFTSNAAKTVVKKLRRYNAPQKASGPSVTAGFDVEILYIAQKNGFKIKDVPVEWHYVESRRINPIKDSLQAIADLIAIKRNSILGQYG